MAKKNRKEISIAGMTCYVEGDTEEELEIDEIAAREFADRYHNDEEEMRENLNSYYTMYQLSKDLDEAIGAPIFTKLAREAKGGK